MPHLFEPLTLRGLTLANRILVSPMCQYSSADGSANDCHFVHLGSRPAGCPALVLTAAAPVPADGRISPDDLGIWKDAHVAELQRIVRFIHAQGARAAIQLAHAGRKGSTKRPWSGQGKVDPAEGGWQPVGPGVAPFVDSYPIP